MDRYSDKTLTFTEKRELKKIAKGIENHENSTIIRPYGLSFTRLLRRIEYKVSLSKYIKQGLDKYIFVYYDCDFGEAMFIQSLNASLSRYSDKEDWLSKLFDLASRKFYVTLICNNFSFDYKHIQNITNMFGEVDKRYTNICVVMNPSEYYGENLDSISKYTIVSHNLIEIKLLDDKETDKYISKYLKSKKSKLSTASKKKLKAFASGIPTILKNSIRTAIKNGNDIEKGIYSNEVVNIVNIFWNNLHERERTLLIKLANGLNAKGYENELEYLKKFRLIDEKNRVIGNWINLVRVKPKERKLRIKGKSVYVKNISISPTLTLDENLILIKLIQKKYISKDSVARIKWKGSDKYSEWAIHKSIQRLRNKLNVFGFPDSTIENVHGKGYSLNQ